MTANTANTANNANNSDDNYKDTLNLPKTGFPMKANLAHKEPIRLKKWQEQNIYHKIREFSAGGKSFILHDGPPYANGPIHIGHAFNKILKDIIIKSKTLSGYDAPYIPGWDCHGLPIELQVEKKVGKPGVKVSANDFRGECRKYAIKQVVNQSESFQRLGVFGLWEKPYLTMNFNYESSILLSLAKIIENKHLTRGFKPVHWCCACRSSLAEAEVIYKDKISPAIDVGFKVIDLDLFKKNISKLDKAKLDNIKHVYFVIWTTTPWTLPANQAVALGSEINYVLLETDKKTGKYAIIAKDLVDDFISRCALDKENLSIIIELSGDDLCAKDIKLQHPLIDKRHVPLIIGHHVTTESGTGCVHIAPAHGEDDFKIGKEYDLPMDLPVGNNGRYLDSVENYAGLFVFDANEKIVEDLKKLNVLFAHEEYDHSYPHCWRHKTPLIFRATPQWFISMKANKLQDKAWEGIQQVKWIPSFGQKRIEAMVKDRPDWCISRQRTWGVPLALFIHKETHQIHPDSVKIMHKAAELVGKNGIEAWFNAIPTDFLSESDADMYDKCEDVLDVWFDSGVSHQAVCSERESLRYPADLYLEGSDQHRGWFQTSLLSGVAITDIPPFKEVLTHGFTVDAKGHKMSKSLGNVVAPKDVMNKYGADILRLWVANCDYQGDLRFSDEIIKRVSDMYRRLRNTAKFLLSNCHDFDPKTNKIKAGSLLSLDLWILKQALVLQDKVKIAYEEYNFHDVCHLTHNFCVKMLGSFYLDIIKDRQYTLQADSIARRSAQTAMYYILHVLVRILSPILSFTADEIWDFMPDFNPEFSSDITKNTVFCNNWLDLSDYLQGVENSNKNSFSDDNWLKLIELRENINVNLEKTRNCGKIGSALEADLIFYAKGDLFNLLKQLESELRFVFITSDAKLEEYAKSSSVADNELIKLNDDCNLVIKVSESLKCVRCWQHRDSVGKDEKHSKLCDRCIENIEGSGEKRLYV